MDNRLAFVTNEYRETEETDLTVRAKCPQARIISLETNLDLAGATLRAVEELAHNKDGRQFEVAAEMVLSLDSFTGSPPRFSIYSPRDGLNGETFRVTEVVSLNLQTGITVVRVRP